MDLISKVGVIVLMGLWWEGGLLGVGTILGFSFREASLLGAEKVWS